MKKLIFVHGRNQQGKDPVGLLSEWTGYAQAGVTSIGHTWPTTLLPEMPFYGDRLIQLIEQLDSPTIETAIERGAGNTDSELEFRGELLLEIAAQAGISQEEIEDQFQEDIRRRGGNPEVVERGPGNWEWVHSILKLLDRTSLGAKVIDGFTRDVYVYLTKGNVQRKIDEIVRASISNDPCVIVAHSLGSVVAYHILKELDGPQNITFITVGSPLGIRTIRKHLGVLKMPARVRHWYNAMDEKDIVALYPLDDNNFDITPPIKNKTTVDNQTGEHHGIEGYLKDPDVAQVLYDGLL
jgi:hypothetical protein